MHRPVSFKRIILTLFCSALGSVVASAQIQPNKQADRPAQRTPAQSSESLVLSLSEPPRGCPVSMHAQQRGLSDLVKVKDSDGKPALLSQTAQRIRLILSRPEEELLTADADDSDTRTVDQTLAKSQLDGSDGKIVSAKMTVIGTSSRGRFVPVADSGSAPSGKAKTLDVSFVHSGRAASANLLLAGFTSISSITLQSITYADGTLWTPAAGSSCKIAPDPVMLVGSESR